MPDQFGVYMYTFFEMRKSLSSVIHVAVNNVFIIRRPVTLRIYEINNLKCICNFQTTEKN